VPHEIESAKSGRAKCRACKLVIDKGDLRLGEEVPNAFGDGEARHWYHLRCGALRRPEAFLEASASIAENEVSILKTGELDALRELAEPGVTYYRLSRFVKVHTAPSGRARCQGCRDLIEKGQLRFVLERIEDGMVSGSGFVHVMCAHKYAGAVDGILERVRNLSELGDDDWAQVNQALTEQAALPRVVPEPHAPQASEETE
jgi:hypothetical protein